MFFHFMGDARMKIVVDINHPAHVHFFKNFIWKMTERGHQILVIASLKDVVYKLLDVYKIPYIKLGDYGKTFVKKAVNIPVLDYKMYTAVRGFHPDLFIGIGSIRASHVSRIFRKYSITFDDTEHSWEQRILYMPFTDIVCTPNSFKLNLGKKQIRYDGYHQLAFLHPNYFTPNPSVLGEMGLDPGEIFTIVRFVSWGASHDIGQKGISDKKRIITELEKYGRVLITSEKPLLDGLEKNRISVSPEKFHDLLSYASLYVGEGGSVASEAVVLGVHSIFISSLGKECGVFSDQAEYGLQFLCESDEEVLVTAKELLSDENLRMLGKKKQRKLLEDKIDVTSYMIDLVETYDGKHTT